MIGERFRLLAGDIETRVSLPDDSEPIRRRKGIANFAASRAILSPSLAK